MLTLKTCPQRGVDSRKLVCVVFSCAGEARPPKLCNHSSGLILLWELNVHERHGSESHQPTHYLEGDPRMVIILGYLVKLNPRDLKLYPHLRLHGLPQNPTEDKLIQGKTPMWAVVIATVRCWEKGQSNCKSRVQT